MTTRPANDVITLSHGGNTVELRPSLRVAAYLERLHDGFEHLFNRVDQFDTATIKAIITIAATDPKAANAMLSHAATQPLHGFTTATHGAIISLITALIPAPADTDQAPTAATATPMTWASFYKELYRIGTGWLGWTPDATWSATPTEITEAFAGHMDKLKAIHGAPDDQDTDTGITEEQRAENVAAGLDPEFDRQALRALKAKHAQ